MSLEQYLKDNPQTVNGDAVDAAEIFLKEFGVRGIPIYVAGNGGSAYTANHFSQDLVKACGFNSYSLSESVGLITAIGNDLGFDNIFEFQLKNKGNGLLVLISFSGMSTNIIKAAKCWKNKGYKVISFTGKDGGVLKELSDVNVNVFTENIFLGESVHSMLLHYLIDQLKDVKNELDVS